MKILHIAFSSEGGAGIGVKRLHEALIKKKIKSELFFFLDDLKKNNSLIKNFKWKLIIVVKKLILKFLTARQNKETISLNLINNLDINNIIKKKNFDAVHLHWVGNEMVSIKEISNIKKPVIWTFHDMWPFVGAEHFCYDRGFLNQYKLVSRNKFAYCLDLDRLVWREKFKYFKEKNFNIIVPSKWMLQNVIKSKLFIKSKKIILPYLIDLKKWKKSRSIKIKKDRIRLLFVATSSVNYRKGFNYLFEALDKYLEKNKYSLLVVGDKPKKFDQLDIEKKFIPTVNDEKKMIKIFNSSDIFVLPSICESFGQVFIEAGSLGLPCVTFDKTAASEVIYHKKNGYLAKFKSSKDLAQGIIWATRKYQNISEKKKIRNLVLKKFSTKNKIDEYIKLYEYSINNHKNNK